MSQMFAISDDDADGNMVITIQLTSYHHN